MNSALFICPFVCPFAIQDLRNCSSVFSYFLHEAIELKSNKSEEVWFLKKNLDECGEPTNDPKMRFFGFCQKSKSFMCKFSSTFWKNYMSGKKTDQNGRAEAWSLIFVCY